MCRDGLPNSNSAWLAGQANQHIILSNEFVVADFITPVSIWWTSRRMRRQFQIFPSLRILKKLLWWAYQPTVEELRSGVTSWESSTTAPGSPIHRRLGKSSSGVVQSGTGTSDGPT